MNALRKFTMARVGLGRAGNSIPTPELLAFQLAHARARDAVHFPFDAASLDLPAGVPRVSVRSAAENRTVYLRRPDLGRRLHAESKAELDAIKGPFDVVFVIADGLSALAVHRHAPAVLTHALALLEPANWRIAPIVTVEQGRVAIADEIGASLQASLSVILIGERPGLSSPDSLGIYLTWSPQPGRTDAERNCISNIHGNGLSSGAAAELLLLLMGQARVNRVSGVALVLPTPPIDTPLQNT
jgi:ethanolamine ammonia-lyase small subunit